ncbi:MAG: alpha-glucosidase/alpha-galactosidase [Ignisphaera sp.]|nr:alpha-glucosidase/alpha-galactosidase [Ignisphaera sp.]MCX8167504.1 alpha-glucosidase/alpha-galactosidase [Ignisphaera sp.]MDW8084633.1 alpha-glucosidase/alpha-galactosidase [Ignisphaera sp.]
MDGLKIAFIGAGSAVWSSRVIIDLLINKNLSGKNLEIWLMDISDWRLNLITAFAKRYIDELKVSAKVYATKDRREAIKDADFVINSAMAGGHSYYEILREVSEKYGYYRGINSVEWNYVSDYHTIWGYYQFKLTLGIAQDIEELAPDAWFINVANPVFELTTLINRATKVKHIGLCHGHMGFLKAIEVLGMRLAEEKLGRRIVDKCAAHNAECYAAILSLIDPKDVEVEMSGFNHVIWLTKFSYKGEDAYKYIDEWIKKDAEEYWRVWKEHVISPFDVDLSPAAIDMYKTYGLLPIGDSVRGGTWKYHWDLKTKQYWYGPYGGPDSEIGWAMYLAALRMRLEELAKAVYDTSTPIVKSFPPEPSGEQLVEIIDAIVNDIPKDHYYIRLPYPGTPPLPVPIQTNILNNGVVSGVPDNVAVEIPVKVDGKGVHRRQLAPLPSKVHKYVIIPRLMRMEWALEAFLKGGRDTLFNWLIVDPRTKSTKQVEETIDAILKIPGNEEMAKHFS